MKAITLTQPWATLVATGAKKIETRSWRTDHRGPLVIHAGKGFAEYRKSELNEILKRPFFAEALRREDGSSPRIDELPLGQIIAVCRLVDCRQMGDGKDNPFFDAEREFDMSETGPLTPQERAFGSYCYQRWAWILDNVTPIEPIPFRGGLGLWEMDADLCFPQGEYPEWLRNKEASL